MAEFKGYKIITTTRTMSRLTHRRVGNLLRFVSFLDRAHPNWRWFDVYYSGVLIGGYTSKRRPTRKRI